ncbi:MAG: type II secretion system F family protein [Thermoplasmatota archaeon]
MEILEHYKKMDMSLRDFILGGIVPAVIIFVIMFFFPDLIYPDILLEGYLSILTTIVIPTVIIIVVLIFPIISRKLKEEEIDSKMHLFITYFWSISTSTVPQAEMLEKLASVDEYGALTDEIKKIYSRMKYWDIPLPEAARDVAQDTPSEKLSDFLTRLAHSQEAGENLNLFLEKEHSVVLKDYETDYKAALETLELLKEVFIALMTSTLFLIVFLSILPIFQGGTPTVLLAGGLLVFVIMEVIMLVAVKTMLPNDSIWHSLDIKNKMQTRMKKILPVTIGVSALLFFIFYSFYSIDLYFVLGISLSPLIIPGILTYLNERNLKRCDNNYDAFMRAIASSTAVGGGSVETALAKLRRYDFGPLTDHVNQLYKRLLTRIDEEKAWAYFASGTGSNLIANFTDIYTGSMDLGADTRNVSDIISDTFVRLMSLRKDRYQKSSSMVGVLYGLELGAALTLTLTLNIAAMMDDSLGMMVETSKFSGILHTVGYSTGMIDLFILVTIIVHAVFASLTLIFSAGSHKLNSLYHIIPMLWIGIITSLIGKTVMQGVIS